LLILVTLLAGAGWWTWRWWSAPTPPELPGELEPAVREHLERLRAKVLDAPRSGTVWGELGMGLFGNGQRELAFTCLAQAERLDPDSPIWPHLQAIKFHLDDNIDAALACLERTVPKGAARDRDNFVPRLLLAELLLDRYQEERAATHARWVLELEPDNARAHFLLGVIACGHGDAQTSLQHLSQAATSPCVRKKSYQQLATVHRRLNQEAVAQQFAHEASQLPADLDWPDPYYQRAMQNMRGSKSHLQVAKELRKDGKLQESLRYYREAIEEIRDPSAQIALAKALMQFGDFALAESVLRAALRQQPDLVQAYQQLSLVLLEEGETLPPAAAPAKFREAAASARQALERQPQHAASQWVLGLALRRLGQKEDALAALAEAVRLRPDRYQYHLHLGETLAETGRLDEALRHLRIAVDLAPSSDVRPAAALERWQTAAKKT